MSRRRAWPLAACLSGAVLTTFVLAGGSGPIRVVLAIWFLFTGAGMALVPALGIPAARTELLVGAAINIVIDTLVATGLAAAGALTTANALVALLIVCLIGAGLSLSRAPLEPRWRH